MPNGGIEPSAQGFQFHAQNLATAQSSLLSAQHKPNGCLWRKSRPIGTGPVSTTNQYHTLTGEKIDWREKFSLIEVEIATTTPRSLDRLILRSIAQCEAL